jgi:hypothetical protein
MKPIGDIREISPAGHVEIVATIAKRRADSITPRGAEIPPPLNSGSETEKPVPDTGRSHAKRGAVLANCPGTNRKAA